METPDEKIVTAMVLTIVILLEAEGEGEGVVGGGICIKKNRDKVDKAPA